MNNLKKSSFFYTDLNDTDQRKIKLVINTIESLINEEATPIFVLNKPLGVVKSDIEYSNACVFLHQKHKIIFIDFGPENQQNMFNDYFEDFSNDIYYQSRKYNYTQLVGKLKEWKDKFLVKKHISEIDDFSELVLENHIESHNDQRILSLLISLFTGSINDASKIKKEYDSDLLAQIKQRIIMFDGNQSRFLYSTQEKKFINIQGMAGTGKTELLMHKLKDIYVNNPNEKVVFTCFNKVLANELKTRITSFFNFMKVEEQIAWNERLWVMSSWGSAREKNIGLYGYICDNYGIQFIPYSRNYSLEKVSKAALDQLKQKKDFIPCFDYILIDESQDFGPNFIELCRKVSKEQVIIAGDIFQDIFFRMDKYSRNPDFTLNHCYRTDPHTLMFAHSVGLGLYENMRIRWLNKKEWEACGYKYEDNGKNANLSRIPLKRFGLEEKQYEPVILKKSEIKEYEKNVISIIKEIKAKFPSVQPEDIAIVFLDEINDNYDMASRLSSDIYKEFKWDTSIGYNTKVRADDKVYISNRNNVKGLEFPFVICVVKSKINNSISARNSIYMMLTRSFISSYLLINENDELEDTLVEIIKDISVNDSMNVTIPNNNEVISKEELKSLIAQDTANAIAPIENLIKEVFPNLDVLKIMNIKKKMEDIPIEKLSKDDVVTMIKMFGKTIGIKSNE